MEAWPALDKIKKKTEDDWVTVSSPDSDWVTVKPNDGLDEVRAMQAAKYPARTDGKPTAPETFMDRAAAAGNTIKNAIRQAAAPIYDVARGFGQGAAQTLSTVGNAARKIPVIGPALDIDALTINVPDDIANPQNAAQRFGHMAEKTAEFMAPGKALTAIAKAKNLGVAGKAGLEAMSAFGVSKAQGATNDEGLKTALLAGGLSGAAAYTLKGLGKLGEHVELTALRPYKSVIEDVTDAERGKEGIKLVKDVFKYGLGGSLEKTVTKSEDLLNSLEASLQAALKSQPGAKVNLVQAVTNAKAELLQPGKLARNIANNQAIETAFAKHLEDIAVLEKNGVTANGAADLLTANQVKRGLGEIGSWMNGFADPDNQAKQIVANAIYKQVRMGIETAAGSAAPKIQEINKAFGDVIPIYQAAVSRIPVASRNNIIGLKEFIGLAAGGAHGVGLSIVERALRTPSFANLLAGGAQRGPAIAPAVGRSAAGLSTAFRPPVLPASSMAARARDAFNARMAEALKRQP